MTQFAPVLLTEEEFAQREPLTARLHGLVRSNPKGVGLVQEFLQNADDAGAQSLSVFLGILAPWLRPIFGHMRFVTIKQTCVSSRKSLRQLVGAIRGAPPLPAPVHYASLPL